MPGIHGDLIRVETNGREPPCHLTAAPVAVGVPLPGLMTGNHVKAALAELIELTPASRVS
jgi:hypothetical protein